MCSSAFAVQLLFHQSRGRHRAPDWQIVFHEEGWNTFGNSLQAMLANDVNDRKRCR